MTDGINDIPAIIDDSMIAIAEAAEKRIDAVNKMRRLALKVTNVQDWVDQNGKPYLMSSGGEKIARLFGISWRIDESQYREEEGGHFEYTYKGYFTLGNTTIEAIGTRSSKDKFFNKYEYEDDKKEKILLPPSAIDKGDVKKAAYTNCIGNGITRLLGIRNLTWEDIRSAGIDTDRVSKVEYRKEEMSQKGKDIKMECHKIMVALYGDNYSAELEKLTSFTANDGKTVAGKKTLAGLSEKALHVTYGKIKEIWDKHNKTTSEKGVGDSSSPQQIPPAQDKNNAPPSPPPQDDVLDTYEDEITDNAVQKVLEKMEIASSYVDLVKARKTISEIEFAGLTKEQQEIILKAFAKHDKKFHNGNGKGGK